MSEATVRCPKCGNEGIVITELLDSDLSLIADSLHAEIERLRAELDRVRANVDLWGVLESHRYCDCKSCDDLKRLAIDLERDTTA